MSHIEGKVIAITGAAGGFGRLVACKAAERGGLVVACDINEAELRSTVDMVEAAGGKALGIRADVTDPEDMAGLVAAAVDRFGCLDVLVNNAGTMPLAFFADHQDALHAWHRCIDINFKGVLNGITAAYDQMIAQGRGHIVNLSSIYSNFPLKGAAVYGATKAAVNFLSESLRQESQGRIKVTTIRPTGIPVTGIVSAVVNADAGAGIVGSSAMEFGTRFTALLEGKGEAGWNDPDNIEYFLLAPELLADQIIYAIDQPWGVSISDLTVRASGDMYVV
jgi:NADP-dependent 3-hydroxy acid dehydrogenase YdfG